MQNPPDTFGTKDLLPEEQAAYDRMQAVLSKNIATQEKVREGTTQTYSRQVINTEGAPFDISSVAGRKARSSRNIEYMRKHNLECPQSFLDKAVEQISHK